MEVELLITAVEKRQMLYDKTSPDYSNRNYVNAEWKKIAEEIGCDEKEARRRWKKLRDYFQKSHREMTSMKSGSTAGKKKKWYLYDRMQFILPHMMDKNTSTNMSICSDEDGIDNEDTISLASASSFALSPQVDTPTSFPTDEGVETQPCVNPPTQQNPSRKRQRPFPQQRAAQPSEFENEMLKAAKRLGEKNVVPTEVDEDEHYFKSLVPNMKLLSAIDKMECRTEIQMVVLRYMKKAKEASCTVQQPEIVPFSPPNPSTYIYPSPGPSTSSQARVALNRQMSEEYHQHSAPHSHYHQY